MTRATFTRLIAPTRAKPGLLARIAFVCLALFVFSVPWSDSLAFSGLGTISKLIGFLAFIFGTLSVVRLDGIRVRALPAFLVVFVLFIMWLAATMFWTLDQDEAQAYVFTLIMLVAMSWLVWQLASDERRRRSLLQMYVLGCFVSVGDTFIQFLAGNVISGSSEARFAAVGFNANYLASTLALAIPMAWYLFARASRKPVIVLNVLAIPIILAGIILTGSRGGAISAAVGLMIIPPTYARLRPFARMSLLLMVVLVAAGVYFMGPVIEQRMPAGLERFAETSSQLESGDLTGRVDVWRAGLRAFRARPILGWGAGAYAPAIEPYLGYAKTAHNAFIKVMTESGLIGLALFLTTLTLISWPIVFKRFEGRMFYLVLLALVLLSLVPSTLENGKQVWFALAIIASRRALMLPSERIADLRFGAPVVGDGVPYERSSDVSQVQLKPRTDTVD